MANMTSQMSRSTHPNSWSQYYIGFWIWHQSQETAAHVAIAQEIVSWPAGPVHWRLFLIRRSRCLGCWMLLNTFESFEYFHARWRKLVVFNIGCLLGWGCKIQPISRIRSKGLLWLLKRWLMLTELYLDEDLFFSQKGAATGLTSGQSTWQYLI